MRTERWGKELPLSSWRVHENRKLGKGIGFVLIKGHVSRMLGEKVRRLANRLNNVRKKQDGRAPRTPSCFFSPFDRPLPPCEPIGLRLLRQSRQQYHLKMYDIRRLIYH